jgi:glutathione S-transferase
MSKYDLYYVKSRGRAEVARLLFHAAGVEFNDHQYDRSEFEKLIAQSPLGAVPWLEVDGVKLPQSVSLARFLAGEFNMDGKTSIEKAHADIIVDTYLDLVAAITPVFRVPDGVDKVNIYFY